jgi:Ca2+-binding EF-hand superfamily protein|tara:strand:- start:201 stop:410 length:210 start_codon:yes stop_codon:yes gene_type:complete
LNSGVLQRDVNKQDDQSFMPPTIEDIVEMFEFLDEDRSGMIKAENFMSFLETAERIKISNVDLAKYKEG